MSNYLDIIDSTIKSAIANQFVYSKVQFDNAKDTKTLHFAAEENAKLLLNAVEYRLHERLEQLLSEFIDERAKRGDLIVKIGDKLYGIKELKK